MKMLNMANGRDGFPCALNLVGDIFQRGTLPFETEASIDLGESSQEKKVLVGQIADSAASPRPFRREMRFWREMPKDLYHLYQLNKLDCISEGYTGTGHLSICTKAVPTCTTYTQGEASSELVKAATYKAKGNSRSQSSFFLAGPLSLIFSSTKVTALEESKSYAGVTVSMTSGASKTSGKCDSGSHLSSPKLASAKYRQHRSPMQGVTVTSRHAINGLACAHVVGVCPDNLLNRKVESAFVQAADIAQTLCVSFSYSQNQQGLGSLRPRHVQKNDFRTLEDVLATVKKKGSIRSATLWHGEEVGQVFGNFLFSALSLRPQASITHDEKLALGFSVFSRSTLASISSISSWGKRMFFFADLLLVLPLDTLLPQCSEFYVRPQYSKKCGNVSIDMCAQKGLTCAHSIKSGYYNVQRLRVLGTTTEASNHNVTGGNIMACSHDTQTRPKFTDTYWIVPCYETTPYGKVSFTRQDRRTFIAMFKDSRLIWAGRQPVSDFTQGLKDPKSQKVGVKRSANPTSSTKGTESRLQFNQSPGLLVRKMPHEGIEEISIPQGMVKITTPSTIEEISTVPATVSDIATVQGVAHV